MRITAGNFRGRILRVPKAGEVRPTEEIVRQALFSMMAGDILGASFLDLFAGTGAVGLEALSRGAREVVWVEGNRAVSEVTKRNVTEIAGEDFRSSIINMDVLRYVRGPGRNRQFNIVFADPPYILGKENGLKELAETIKSCGVIAPDGILVTEMAASSPVIPLPGWLCLRDRVYGKTRLVIRMPGEAPKIEEPSNNLEKKDEGKV